MDENDIKLLAEIESLKSQIAELRMAQAGMENVGGTAGGIGAMLVPIGNVPGATHPPGNFEPTFAEDQSDHKMKLDDVGEGFCPFGRLFYQTVTVDSSAKIERGYIYLEVVHPVSSSNAPTIYVKGDTARPAFDSTNDTSKSLIPLYYIDGGRITVDYRSCMSLTIREL